MPFRASWVQQQLAKRLVELRAQSGLAVEDAAAQAGFSRQKLNRIEGAKVKVEPRDVRELCRIYGALEEERELCDMAVASRTDAWWEPYDQWLTPSYRSFIGYENDARRLVTIQPALIPGLMQTPAYTRDVYAVGGMTQDPDRLDALVEVRRLRQRRLTDPQPLELFAVIGEAALRTPYGGGEFRDQLRHLRALLELPNVAVRVAPFVHPAGISSLQLIEFEVGGPAVAISETLWGNVVHDAEREVKQARRFIERVTVGTLSEGESTAFIEKHIRETT